MKKHEAKEVMTQEIEEIRTHYKLSEETTHSILMTIADRYKEVKT